VTRRLRVHPSAEAEVDEAAAFYDERQPGVGHDFVVAVGVAVRSALSRPRIGSPVSIGGSSLDVRRVRVRPFDYQVVYAVHEDHVFVLAVAHNKRRPHYWTERVAE
jgi:plasmid stabilization system protein ParE